MHTAEALLGLHERAHGSLQRLLAHCRQLSAEELDRELAGFGYPSVRLQLHHVIGGEEYWIGVLEGTVGSLEAYRRRVFSATEKYLRAASAHVFMRTLTHIYHHQGQIVAMCRLGKPTAAMDYPIAPDSRAG
jgi:uncharacterized damage-inducible protein DinB